MKKTLLTLLLAAGLYVASAAGSQPQDLLPVIPRPAKSECGEGYFAFPSKCIFAVTNDEQRAAAAAFAKRFADASGITPRIKRGTGGDVCFVADPALADEAYVLDVTPKRIEVRASGRSGYFYALQTLRQLLPVGFESAAKSDAVWQVPAVHIEDSPRFGYRGMLLDVSRYFMPKDEVLRLVECMSMLKINKLHMHLTDDNGWRLEIKRYPKLTEVGAWRVEREGIPFPDRRNPQPGEETPVGGFYTQDDIREIVAYAAERCIEVIPEIDMPAHANSALAAYPELACPVVDKFIGVLPGLGGDSADIIYCAGNDKVFEFLQNVLDEVMALFPSRYIHLGGDEAWKTHWKTCPLCQARIAAEHLENEEELQGWFMQKMCSYVRSKGREVIGWDELTNSKLPEGVIIDGWQGMGNAALKAAAQGHRFIMTPARIMYFIRYQGPQWFEPLTYFGNNTLADVYNYEPVQANWPAAYEPLLMGVQACMWTEFCASPRDVQYQLFPRLTALAEVAWCPKNSKEWKGFLKRLDAFLPRLDAHDITHSTAMYNIQQKVTPADGGLRVELECIRPDVEIRYTADGSEPTASSPLYTGPLTVGRATTLRCATFAGGRRMGAVLTLPIGWNKATAKRFVESRPDDLLLLNGLHGSLKQTDFEWCTWSDCNRIEKIIDLGAAEELHTLVLGFINNHGMAVHKPESIRISISEDNRNYTQVAERTFTPDRIFLEGTGRTDETFDLGGRRARYVWIDMCGPGVCPVDHVRPGKAVQVYMDEIEID